MRLRYILPVPVKKFLKNTLYSIQDIRDKMIGNYDPKYPPRKLNYVGSHDFRKVGDEFLGHFVKLGGLQKTDRVLDIGSGVGRMAIPLAEHLSESGSYAGFDIDKRGVEWCQENITPNYPNFQFQFTDIYNLYYNQSGTVNSADFVFPYEENSFDFIFATSVFTHMRTAEIEQYFKEIKRVLTPGGKILVTFFLLNDEVRDLMKAGNSNAYFAYQDKDNSKSFYSHKNNPEAEIGYEEAWVRENLSMHFSGNIKINPGFWSGRSDGVSYQDIIVVS